MQQHLSLVRVDVDVAIAALHGDVDDHHRVLVARELPPDLVAHFGQGSHVHRPRVDGEELPVAGGAPAAQLGDVALQRDAGAVIVGLQRLERVELPDAEDAAHGVLQRAIAQRSQHVLPPRLFRVVAHAEPDLLAQPVTG